MSYSRLILPAASIVFLFCLQKTPLLAQNKKEVKVAFLADIHFQEVYGDFQSDRFRGIPNPKNGKLATIRTMESQLNSTRLFNENYFALLTALEEIKEQGIQLVVIPGDFSDDGQAMNILGLKKILHRYSTLHGLRFFMTTGNHDPVSPFGSEGGKRDFLGENGRNQGVFSLVESENDSLVQSSSIKNWGYDEIQKELSDFGFIPREEDVFWTHPFIPFSYENYAYESQITRSQLHNRLYKDPKSGLSLPDVSYLVEPVEGLWLLALDANVYTYSGDLNQYDSTAWRGSSEGFNKSYHAKPHQLNWIKQISQEAKKRGKTLISFSHYPLADFHEGASEKMKELFGKVNFQLQRVPQKEISRSYAEAGIRVHFAGHMHINDTGKQDDANGVNLLNIQIPSLAAFPPAYKIMKLDSSSTSLEIKTALLEHVDRFSEFFDLYTLEHNYLQKREKHPVWNLEILEAKNYLSYTQKHLEHLIQMRFLKSDWPEDLGLLVSGINLSQLEEFLNSKEEEKVDKLNLIYREILQSNQKGMLMDDFYLIKNGGDLGLNLIPEERLLVYQKIGEKKFQTTSNSLVNQFSDFLQIFDHLSRGLPSGDFQINLKDLHIKRLD